MNEYRRTISSAFDLTFDCDHESSIVERRLSLLLLHKSSPQPRQMCEHMQGRSRDRERRWTTGIEKGQLPIPFNTDSVIDDSSMVALSQINHCHHVILELLETEKKYVNDLGDIINGYFKPLNAKVGYLNVTQDDVSKLFGNIEEIKSLHENLLMSLQSCDNDCQRIGQCFVDKSDDFKIYTTYCNNYPELVDTLSKISVDSEVSSFMKACQTSCNHPLQLGAYLLKPVQRVLKYALLLKDISKHMSSSDTGFMEIKVAMERMTDVAEHINAMKKKHDEVVHIHEIQTLLSGWEGEELVKYGNLVLEDTLHWDHSKTGSAPPIRLTKEFHVFLFQKLILIIKKKDKDEGYQYKYHVEMKDAQLKEHLIEPTCFQIRQISSKRTLTFQARTVKQKDQWSSSIKTLLIESFPDLPDKANKLILAGFTTDLSNLHETAPWSMTVDRKHYRRKDGKNDIGSPLKITHKSFEKQTPATTKHHPSLNPAAHSSSMAHLDFNDRPHPPQNLEEILSEEESTPIPTNLVLQRQLSISSPDLQQIKFLPDDKGSEQIDIQTQAEPIAQESPTPRPKLPIGSVHLTGGNSDLINLIDEVERLRHNHTPDPVAPPLSVPDAVVDTTWSTGEPLTVMGSPAHHTATASISSTEETLTDPSPLEITTPVQSPATKKRNMLSLLRDKLSNKKTDETMGQHRTSWWRGLLLCPGHRSDDWDRHWGPVEKGQHDS